MAVQKAVWASLPFNSPSTIQAFTAMYDLFITRTRLQAEGSQTLRIPD